MEMETFFASGEVISDVLVLPGENCSANTSAIVSFPLWAGYAAAAIAVIFFGIQGWPIKRANTGDGMFFQFFLCTGIWMVGLVVQFARNSAFEPLAMLGGALWCTGNILTVPIVKTIGFSQGLLLWSTLNLTMGWLSGRFGLFGIQPNTVTDPLMNVFGAVLALLSAILFAAIKTTVSTTETREKHQVHRAHDEEEHVPSTEKDPLLAEGAPLETPLTRGLEGKPRYERPWIFDRLSPVGKRIIGVAMACVAGVFYGTNFDPPQYLQDHSCLVNLTDGRREFIHSPVAIDYVFSHFTGIFTMSLIYLMIYSAAKKGRPAVDGSAFLYGILAGILWGVADASWFVANGTLQFVVAFPLVCTGPSFVASALGIFVFKEIVGVKNYLILAGAFLIAGGGITLIVLSH